MKATLKIKANGDEESKEVVLKIITTRVSAEGDEKAAVSGEAGPAAEAR